MKRFAAVIFSLFLLTSLAGCGYYVSPEDEPLDTRATAPAFELENSQIRSADMTARQPTRCHSFGPRERSTSVDVVSVR